MNQFNLEDFGWQVVGILKRNAPIRDYDVPSPYGPPGYLQREGMTAEVSGNQLTIRIGGARVPYAPYTEKTSRKAGWIKKSVGEARDILIHQFGGRTE